MIKHECHAFGDHEFQLVSTLGWLCLNLSKPRLNIWAGIRFRKFQATIQLWLGKPILANVEPNSIPQAVILFHSLNN